MIVAITTIAILAQRSEADIEKRRSMSAAFFPIHERMMRASDLELVHRAGSLKSDERAAAVGEIVDRRLKWVAPELCAHLSSATPANLRVITIDGLGRLKNPVAIKTIRSTFSSRDTSVKLAAAISLGMLGDRSSVPSIRQVVPLVDELQKRKLVQILTGFKDKGSESQVRVLLKSAKYQGLRATCAESLGVIGNVKSSAPALIKALQDDYPNVRAAAATSLENLGDQNAIPALKKALNQNSPQASNAPGMEARSKVAISRAIGVLAAR